MTADHRPDDELHGHDVTGDAEPVEPAETTEIPSEGTGAPSGPADAPTAPSGHDAPPPPPPAAPRHPQASQNPQPSPTPPSAIPADSRNWGMAAHLSAFAGAMVALAFVGPLVVWLVKKDEDAYVAHHAKEALNFNLSLLIYAAAGAILAVVTIGIGLVVVVPLLVVGAIGWIVLTIVASVKAANGEGYRYPLTLRLVN